MSEGAPPGRARRTVAVVAVNLLAVIIALFAVSEWFIARKAKTTLLYEPNPHYRQDLSPNQTYTRDGFSYHVGPHGLRGEVPVMPKPAGSVRVAVMGGSSVFDFRVGRSWPERLQDDLRALGLESVEVSNAGIPGFSTREMAPFFERKIAGYDPDVVLFYGGWNDVKYMKVFRRQVSLQPYPVPAPDAPDPYAFLRAPRPERNVHALKVLWQKLRLRAGFVAENTGAAARSDGVRSDGPQPSLRASGGARTDLVRDEAPREDAARRVPTVSTATDTASASGAWADTAGMAYFRGNLERFVEVVRAAGAEPVLVAEATLHVADLPADERGRIAYHYVGLDHDALVAVTEAMGATMKSVAAQHRVTFIDPRGAVSGRPELFFDHVHLTEAGSRAVAATVAPSLAEVVRAARERK